MKSLRIWFILLGLFAVPVFAQSQDENTIVLSFAPDANGIQHIVSRLDTVDQTLMIQFSGLQAPNTLYVYAKGAEGVDLVLQLNGATEEQVVDATGKGGDETLTLGIRQSGDYTLSLYSIGQVGDFVLRVGLNNALTLDPNLAIASNPMSMDELRAQQMLSDASEPQGSNLPARNENVQEFTGTLQNARDEVRIPLNQLQAGYRISATVETNPNTLPFLNLYDVALVNRVAQGNASGAYASFDYMIETDGNYVLTLFSATPNTDYTLRVVITPSVPVSTLVPPVTTVLPPPPPASDANAPQYVVSRSGVAQVFTGQMTPQDQIRVLVQDVREGDVVVASASGVDNFDPFLTLRNGDETIVFATDDNSGGGTVAVIEHTATVSGDMWLTLESKTTGAYTLRVGVNTASTSPALGGETLIGGTPSMSLVRNETREISGNLVASDSQVTVVLNGLQAGDTIYIFARGDDNVDPYVRVLASDNQTVLADDDDSGGDKNAALVFTVDGASPYLVNLYASNSAVGGYRLIVGTNDETILTDNGVSPQTLLQNLEFNCATAPASDRPVLSGEELLLESEHTLIHYTLSGSDATTEFYVSKMRDALENSLAVQFGVLGWRIPPNDCDEGGDNRLDVYVQDISREGAIGYATPETLVGDNPNTPEQEFYAAYSYLILENDMEFVSAIDAIRLMEVTAAHEVHHNIQFGYDIYETYGGFYESGAVWLETLVYPNNVDAYEYDELFLNPNLCLGSTSDDAPLRIYAEWVMVDSLVRDLGATAYQKLWEYLAVDDNLTGFYNGLLRLGTTPESVIQRLAIRNLLRDYAHGDAFPFTVALESTIDGLGVISSQNGIQQQAVAYVAINEPNIYQLTLTSTSSMVMTVVGVNVASQTATIFELNQTGVVDTTAFDYAYVIVQNKTRHFDVAECQFSAWSMDVQDGTALPLSPSTAEVWSALYFSPPN